jgi:predicted RecA/RadA family phage recombinase
VSLDTTLWIVEPPTFESGSGVCVCECVYVCVVIREGERGSE